MSNQSKRDNLAIYQKYTELIYYTNDIVRKFPKSERFVLAEEIKKTIYTGLRLLMYAIKAYPPNNKVKYLEELDTNLCLLKVHIRLAHRYKYISTQNYNSWCNIITDICNMLGGWLNSCQKR
ncbi:MAG: diversity-generating retroelement protein Avd [Clostridia bacterium]|nr:diversity-generating retroelement protein Avd [Clostridia bacterium]